jgi:hypothetical protein
MVVLPILYKYFDGKEFKPNSKNIAETTYVLLLGTSFAQIQIQMDSLIVVLNNNKGLKALNYK